MSTRCPVLDGLRRSVATAADDGASLGEIEDSVVRPADLDDERRAALWLYAWLRVEGTSAMARAA